ncbi:selenophosphate synthase [Melghirimyces profundicolus]|uniref:Selenophosphate synthase n=1 Tax=Melghirimyces profundicolus TaxID=1242148 RepID=A0A2T6C9M1_9BACL|nr:selenophosphate synthase [Melghirimyces profundicolus]
MGLSEPDDAGVIRIDEKTALVQTVDFFTPIVDDPYAFGQIAAANSLSDIYAMGAAPITALNLVGFSVSKLDPSLLAEILRGAADKVKEAGATIIGGHSIDDPEPKFGLAVTGTVHPDRVWRKGGARPGDRLILTKPVGVGIHTTGIKRDKVSPEEIDRVTRVMATLNRQAAETLTGFDVRACTDVTGFGLLGHASEMTRAGCVGFEIDARAVPILPRTLELAEAGVVPGGTKANARHLEDCLLVEEGVGDSLLTVLCDAVTSGGLLAALPEEQAERALTALHEKDVEDARIIGRVTEDHPGKIRVLP